MEIGVSLRSAQDAPRVRRDFRRQFEASGHESRRGHRIVHAHGTFGRGGAASPAATALRNALQVLARDPAVDGIWVRDPAILERLQDEGLSPSMPDVKLLTDDTEVDVRLKLDGPVDEVGRQFEELASRWHRETGLLSSMTARLKHPAYQAIIALGTPVLPYLIEEARAGRGLWHAALHAITGDDPVPDEHAGRVRQIALDWVQWADRHGIVRPR